MEPFILESKLRPPAYTRLIERDRLLVDIHAKDSRRLVVISADAGYGKTTLMTQIFQSAGEGTIWYHFDELDKNVALFIDHLTWSIAKAFPEKAEVLREVIDSSQSKDGAIITWMSRLVNSFDGSDGKRMSLFLDDFHLINDNDEIIELIRFMVAHLCEECRFIIGSRDRPDISLGRLRAQRQVHDITTTDLVFTRSESHRLLTELCSRQIGDEDIYALHDATEGWPIAMVMAAAVTGEEVPDARAIIPSIIATSGSLGDFLAEEIWKSVRNSMKQILMEASLLHEVDTEVLDSVNTERDALIPANGFFQEAMDRHLLTTCLISNKRYRLHSIFKQFLLNKLEATYSGEEIVRLHERYAVAYEGNGDVERAIDHYLKAGLPDEAAAVMEENGDDILEAGKIDTVGQWLKQIPNTSKDRFPALYLLEARILGNQSELERGMEKLNLAKKLLESKGDRRRLFQCEFTRSNFLHAGERFSEALDAAAAAEALAEPYEQHVMAKCRTATLTLLLGDVKAAREKLDEAESSFPDSSNLSAQHIAVQRLQTSFYAGDFKGLLNDTDKLYIIDKPPSLLHERLVVAYMRAKVLFNLCRYDQSLEVIETAVSFLGEEIGAIYRQSLELIRGQNYLYAGQADVGLNIIRQYARPEGTRKTFGPDSEHTYLAAYYRRLGEFDKAEYFDKIAITEHKNSNRLLACAHANLSMAATLFRSKGPEDKGALEFLDNAEAKSRETGYQYVISQVHFYRAWRAFQLDNAEETLHKMNLSLENATRFWHNHFIAQEGRVSLDLLTFAYENDIQRDYLLDIFSIIGQEATTVLTPLLASEDPLVRESTIKATIAAGGILAAPLIYKLLRDPDKRVKEVAQTAMSRLRDEISHPDDVLTNRESEVLAYVAEGISNAEIAEQLYISEPTVKTHLTRIFQKLGVTKRTQAAAFYHRRMVQQD